MDVHLAGNSPDCAKGLSREFPAFYLVKFLSVLYRGLSSFPSAEPLKYLVKKPSKALVYLLSSKEYEGDVQASSDAMIANCVLAGDMDVLEQDASIFTELTSRIGDLMKGARSELKKV